MLITTVFILFLFLPFIFRRRKIKKIQCLDLDRDTEDLEAWEFFYSILKIENVAKAFHYTEILFLVIDGLFILIGAYALSYVKAELPEVSALKDTVLLLFIEPIILWLITLFVFFIALYVKKRENKRVIEMLNDLEKEKFLNSAQKDFFKSDKIVRTRRFSCYIKLGEKYIFSIYPAYIIPYSWIKDVEINKIVLGLHGMHAYYLSFIFKNSWKPLKIYCPKKIVAEEIRNLILSKKENLFV